MSTMPRTPTASITATTPRALRQMSFRPFVACRAALLALTSILILAASLLPLSRALAEDVYTVTYSSSSNPVTNVGPDGVTWNDTYTGTAPNPYGGVGLSSTQPSAGGGGGGRGQGGAPPTNPGPQEVGPGSATCNGTITATLTWQGSEPPPPAVIIQEDAAVGWQGDTDCSCAHGLPGQPSGSVAGASVPIVTATFDVYGEDETVTGYQVINNPGQSFTVTVTPTATASLSFEGWLFDNIPDANTYANYKITPTNIQITFDAPVIGSPGSYKCLVGQQVTASLSITPDPDENSDGSPAYHWSENGGNPFASYTATKYAGVLTPIDPSIYSTASPTAHFSKPGDVTVSCSGSVHGQQFSLSVDLSIEAPSVNERIAKCGPSMYDDQDSDGINGDIGLLGPDTEDYGFQYWLKVETPDDFVSNGDYGTFEFLQTVNDIRYRTIYNPEDTSQTWSQSFGVTGLMGDTPEFPTWSADGTKIGKDGDNPSHTFNTGVLECDYFVLGSFTTYVMYCPPGTGSQYVPVAAKAWDYSCSATRLPGDIWDPTFYPSHIHDVGSPDFPLWTKFSGDYHFWVTSPPWQ